MKKLPVLLGACFIAICALPTLAASDKDLGYTSNLTESQRQNPLALNGMVTSPNYLATQAGLDVIRRGGTAVDAAIATAATLAVVYPQMCTLGGDNFFLIYNAKDKKVVAINASGRAGEKATIEYYKGKGLNTIPSRGYLAANTVPGVVSGWDLAFKYAQDRLASNYNWQDLFATPIDLAVNGFPVSTSLAMWSKIDTDTADKEFHNLQRFSEFKKVFLKPDGSPYKVGEILKQPDLAQSLKLIAKNGASEFY